MKHALSCHSMFYSIHFVDPEHVFLTLKRTWTSLDRQAMAPLMDARLETVARIFEGGGVYFSFLQYLFAQAVRTGRTAFI